ncbi:MAG: anaerobic ribonucleoside-triphosphate reductase activating protein [Clostridia bacterium]|nr:anaerobic ribonucleoside-triphosphate reductase activating protein [Clostridia bacterium]MBQ6383470.1 anaerobic ribonucleoside-triphosphate reductase activating protein [Clostridia bacterium]MBQ6720837.1 anaerobic ribonucleoside-triphosphate reductase activating protein [Clostridia bacterium]
MKIHGLQKMTLLDFPGRVACTVFLGGCDMRCPFCHNAELIDGSAPPVMEEDALLSFLEKRKGLLDGVAFTGGEPLLRDDLDGLFERIQALGYPIKLDTNGTHPDRLARLTGKGLVQYVAMDVKNAPERYAETVGVPDFDLAPVRESVRLLLTGKVPYEFRTTVVAEFHDGESIRGIGEWIRGAERYYLQKFTDRDSVPFAGLHAPSDGDLRAWVKIAEPFVREAGLRGVD